MHRDIYGEALSQFHREGLLHFPLLLHSTYGDIEEMPVDVFFRTEEDFSELEFIALSLCDGKIMDIGAGVGSHVLYLQAKGYDVTALEISILACNIMQERGVLQIATNSFWEYRSQQYDTLLFLMNGIGIAGDLEGFRRLLAHAKTLLTERGQLLFDSSDISYLYEEFRIKRPDYYFGEIGYQYEFQGNKGTPFKWLYLDQKTLIEIAHEEKWVVQILYEDDHDQYLARMEPMK